MLVILYGVLFVIEWFDMAFIVTMHRNKPNITYLLFVIETMIYVLSPALHHFCDICNIIWYRTQRCWNLTRPYFLKLAPGSCVPSQLIEVR